MHIQLGLYDKRSQIRTCHTPSRHLQLVVFTRNQLERLRSLIAAVLQVVTTSGNYCLRCGGGGGGLQFEYSPTTLSNSRASKVH